MNNHPQHIASALNINIKQVNATLQLLDEGGTVPFISRYRKEATGSLDEVQIAAIRDLAQQLKDLDKRRDAILKAIDEQGKLTDILKNQIQNATSLTELEDIYLPYKQKRKTRASIAKEKGLEPLATLLLSQNRIDIVAESEKYISNEKEVKDFEEVLAGARDIIAEVVSENQDARQQIRKNFERKAMFESRVAKNKDTEAIKYKDYFEWNELAKSAPSHRVLAMLRGEDEGLLKLNVLPEDESSIQLLENQFVKGNNEASKQVKMAIVDGYKRLLRPAIETEFRGQLKQKADEEAIRVFTDNARQLLLAAPLGQKNVMAIDPGFRTGCKVVCLDKQGKLLENTTIYPHTGAGQLKDAEWKVTQLCDKYEIEAIAIGNGTAGRETETFVRGLKISNVTIVMVNESGASIYSASTLAREEFPNHDVTVRGAVSIGRRLMDPLAELVKIDPKSIGVGQYQHDVDQSKLQTSLDDTVMSCVNAVGVELNTASKQILAYVSGLGPSLAQNIVAFRDKNGAFKNRESLKKVPRLGDKAFEQAAGFLRIGNAENALDSSGVHPERYALVNQMAKDLGCTISELMKDPDLQKRINLQQYVSAEVGLPTLQDILKELAKPGRDPREQFEAFSFEEGVNAITDLKVGMKLKGIVTNITNFGAFVDVGVHQDGLVHTSQLSNRFVSNPADVVKVSQVVNVTVTDVDVDRKRISLSMKDSQTPKGDRNQTVQSPKSEVKTNKPHQQQKPHQNNNQKVSEEADGDMQAKLAKLKGMFK